MRKRVILRMIAGLPFVSYNQEDVALGYLIAWQQELGPALGLDHLLTQARELVHEEHQRVGIDPRGRELEFENLGALLESIDASLNR